MDSRYCYYGARTSYETRAGFISHTMRHPESWFEGRERSFLFSKKRSSPRKIYLCKVIGSMAPAVHLTSGYL